MRIHIGKEFKICGICSEKLTHSCPLNVHMKPHSKTHGLVKITSNYCGNVLEYDCYKCYLRAWNSDYLKNHKKREHGGFINLDNQLKTMSSMKTFERDTRTEYSCFKQICDKEIELKYRDSHRETHDPYLAGTPNVLIPLRLVRRWVYTPPAEESAPVTLWTC